MYNRDLKDEILAMSKVYPVTTVIGPRQSGKTFLTQHCFPKKPYVNLEDLSERAFAEEDPHAFLARYPDGAIIDEIQRVPALLSYIQVRVDQQKKDGLFILTGSHQLDLHAAITQSLAGRTALLKLLPLSLSECLQNGLAFPINETLLKGGFARVHQKGLQPYKFYSHYCQTYVEKDVRQIINVRDLSHFQRFMRLLAARVSNTLNANDIASDLGVSSPTIQQWFSILEASHLIFRLPPYLENFGKRIIKTPKFYFTDTGLVCYLLGIETENQLDRDPLRGQIFENAVVLEALKTRYNQGLDANLYYYRNQQQLEVDLMYESGSKIVPIEIKVSQTFQKKILQGLDKFTDLSNGRVQESYLVYGGDSEQRVGQHRVVHYRHIYKLLSL